MARLDGHPTGDQEVAVSNLAVSATSFMEIDHEIFSMVIHLPFADSRRAIVSFWRKKVHNTG